MRYSLAGGRGRAATGAAEGDERSYPIVLRTAAAEDWLSKAAVAPQRVAEPAGGGRGSAGEPPSALRRGGTSGIASLSAAVACEVARAPPRVVALVAGHWIDPGGDTGAPHERDFNMEARSPAESPLPIAHRSCQPPPPREPVLRRSPPLTAARYPHRRPDLFLSAQVADAATLILSAKGFAVLRPELSAAAMHGHLKWSDYLDWVRQKTAQARACACAAACAARCLSPQPPWLRSAVRLSRAAPLASSTHPPASRPPAQGVPVVEIHGQGPQAGAGGRAIGVVAREGAPLVRFCPTLPRSHSQFPSPPIFSRLTWRAPESPSTELISPGLTAQAIFFLTDHCFAHS